MKTLLLTVTLLVGVVPVAAAQTQSTCAACIGATGCADRRDACVAECRARLFSIDPKRATCVATCTAEANRCSQTADSSCRARNLCR